MLESNAKAIVSWAVERAHMLLREGLESTHMFIYFFLVKDIPRDLFV